MPLTLSLDMRRPAPARAAASRRRSLWIAGSVALHALALWAVLQVRRPDPAQPIAPSYDLVFDDAGGSATPSTSEQTGPDATPPDQAANPTPQDAPPGAAPQQLAMAPPAPDAAPPPAPGLATKPDTPSVPDPAQTPPDPAPTPQATAQPPTPQPPDPLPPAPEPPVQQAMASPLPEPLPPEPPAQTAMATPDAPPPAALELAPPTPPTQQAMAAPGPVPDTAAPPAAIEILPPAPPPPAVRLALPDPLPQPAQPRDLVPSFTPPAPPAPLPPLPVRPRPAPPRPQFGSLGAPMDLNFGPAASRAPAPRPPGSRGIDFSLGAPKPGPNRSEAFFDIRAKNIGADWAQSLAVYWRNHRFYPPQAAELGEDGTVQVVLVVNRLGRVQSVEVKGRSGSMWLDMAAVAVWRDAQLPPLPAENRDPTITIPLTINYLLIRR